MRALAGTGIGLEPVSGKCRLTLAPDGKTMEGAKVHLGFAWKFPWLIWRPGSSGDKPETSQ